MSHGWAHPLLGLDHLLAIFVAALWASQHAGRARYVLPSILVGGMAAGTVAGFSTAMALPLSGIIAFSAVALGVTMAALPNGSETFQGTVLGLFGLAQGLAHGLAAGQQAGAALHLTSLLAGTAILISIAVSVAPYVRSRSTEWQVSWRAAGIMVAFFCVV